MACQETRKRQEEIPRKNKDSTRLVDRRGDGERGEDHTHRRLRRALRVASDVGAIDRPGEIQR
jgi:hypothetical protein